MRDEHGIRWRDQPRPPLRRWMWGVESRSWSLGVVFAVMVAIFLPYHAIAGTDRSGPERLGLAAAGLAGWAASAWLAWLTVLFLRRPVDVPVTDATPEPGAAALRDDAERRAWHARGGL
jgi:hypothetical protein